MVKKLPGVEKKVKKLSKKNLKDWTKWNRKMGGRSFYIQRGAFGDTLLCRLQAQTLPDETPPLVKIPRSPKSP